MTQPLALVFYEKVMPGSQLVNRLQDLGYRVQPCADTAALLACAQKEGPMLIFTDLHSREDVSAAIARLKNDSVTGHIPIVAFASGDSEPLQETARTAGATLAVNEAAITEHLPQLLEQALRIE